MQVSQTTERPARPVHEPSEPVDLVIVTDPASRVAEAYRSLRATVKFSHLQPPVRSVLIADTDTGGQHSHTAANLAAALALGGDRTILVDANLRTPQLHALFGAPNKDGLTEWLENVAPETLPPMIQTRLNNLRLIVAGQPSDGQLDRPSPADLLSTDRCALLLERLREQAEFVVIDTAPLTDVGDGLTIAPRVDAVLLLVRAGRTRRVPAQRAKESLDRVGARILGAVLTDVNDRSS